MFAAVVVETMVTGGPAVTTTSNAWIDVLPARSVARICTTLLPIWAAVGVQVTTPVDALIEKPAGADTSVYAMPVGTESLTCAV